MTFLAERMNSGVPVRVLIGAVKDVLAALITKGNASTRAN